MTEIPSIKGNKIDEIGEKVLQWFYINRENYLFRNNRTPYRVWISETILQQTRIQAALEKMENFFAHFPDLRSLGAADEADVVNAFKGLGYYNRARNLHKGARYILDNHIDIPDDYDKLLKIPSIGPYTAAAISSICFGKSRPVIDGNIKRIFSRIFMIQEEISKKIFMQDLSLILECLFEQSKEHPGDLNESLMEFGQKICKVKNPECFKCIIQHLCDAYGANNVSKFPVILKPIKKIEVTWKLYFFTQNGMVLINHFNDFYFLKNHIGFPSMIEFENYEEYSTQGFICEQYLSQHKDFLFINGPKHTITNHKINFLYTIIDLYQDCSSQTDLRWVPIQSAEELIVSSGLLKAWRSALSNMIARGGT